MQPFSVSTKGWELYRNAGIIGGHWDPSVGILKMATNPTTQARGRGRRLCPGSKEAKSVSLSLLRPPSVWLVPPVWAWLSSALSRELSEWVGANHYCLAQSEEQQRCTQPGAAGLAWKWARGRRVRVTSCIKDLAGRSG